MSQLKAQLAGESTSTDRERQYALWVCMAGGVGRLPRRVDRQRGAADNQRAVARVGQLAVTTSYDDFTSLVK